MLSLLHKYDKVLKIWQSCTSIITIQTRTIQPNSLTTSYEQILRKSL